MRSESFATRVEAVFTSWEQGKLFFEQATAVSTESLHIIGGVLILFGASALLRKPVSSRWPWLVVLAFTCTNEFIDLSISQWPHPGMQFGESVKDVFVTMLLPSMLLFTARKTPGLYSRKAPPIAADHVAAPRPSTGLDERR